MLAPILHSGKPITIYWSISQLLPNTIHLFYLAIYFQVDLQDAFKYTS